MVVTLTEINQTLQGTMTFLLKQHVKTVYMHNTKAENIKFKCNSNYNKKFLTEICRKYRMYSIQMYKQDLYKVHSHQLKFLLFHCHV